MSKTSPFNFRYFDVVIALFVAVLITSNVASSAKIVDLKFSISGIRLAFDGGTLLFPVAYVLGDVLTEVYGFRAARRAIWTGFIALSLSAVLFFTLKLLPGEESWEIHAGTEAFNAILGGMSTGGIVIASLLAYLAGEFSNSVVLSFLKVFMGGRAFYVRAIGSSLIGEFLDTLVFVSIASFVGVFGWELFAKLVITNYLLKITIEILVFPFTFFITRKLKKVEDLDIFDINVKLNPFGRN